MTVSTAHDRTCCVASMLELGMGQRGNPIAMHRPPVLPFARQGYLPRDYECLSSAYGSEADLRACIAALHEHGVKALADIVLNHRCAGRQVWRTPHQGLGFQHSVAMCSLCSAEHVRVVT